MRGATPSGFWNLQARRLLALARRDLSRGPQTMRVFAFCYPDATFVQVGSNDGSKHDPLHAAVVSRRWRGVMVEPVPYVFERLRRNYAGFPRLRLENVAVAAKSGSQPFHYVAQAEDAGALPAWYDELGSFRKEVLLSHAHRIPRLAERIITVDVPCVTFEELCQRNGVDAIDLLHTDTEGYDDQILATVDFVRLRPVLLIYEHKHLGEPRRIACRRRLAEYGYELFEEGADTWAVDAHARSARHAVFLAFFRALAWVTQAR